MTDSPLVLDVYDRDFQWEGALANPVAFSGSALCNGRDSFQVQVRSSDPMIDAMLAPGARMTVQYRGVALSSGKLRTRNGSLLPNGDVVFHLEGDWRVLSNTLAWVRPDNPLEATSLNPADPAAVGQSWVGTDGVAFATVHGQTGYYIFPGTIVAAESAIKHLIQVNAVDRLARPLTVAPDQARGGNAYAAGLIPENRIRFTPLDEAIAPFLKFSDMVLTLRQERLAQTIGAEMRPRSTWDAPLTVGSGIIVDGGWSFTPPTATRIIVGGPGEGPARVFTEWREWSGDENPEPEYGDIIEVFRDATSAPLEWPDAIPEAERVAKYFLLRTDVSASVQGSFEGYLYQAGIDALAENAAKSGVSARLAESETFYFGGTDGVQLGDRITVQVGEGDAMQLFTDTITEAKFSLTAEGFNVEPVIGTRTDDPNVVLARAIARLAGAQRRLSESR